MSDPARHPGRPSLEFVADLVLEVGDERGSTTARLTSDEEGLVLDVSDPGTLLRCVPRRAWPDDFLGASAVSRFAGISVRVTSRGRQLGRVSFASSGKVRLRPALSGTPALVGTAVGSRWGRVAAGVVAVAVVAVGAVVYLARRRGAVERRWWPRSRRSGPGGRRLRSVGLTARPARFLDHGDVATTLGRNSQRKASRP